VVDINVAIRRKLDMAFETKLVVHNFAEDMIEDRLLPAMNSMEMCTCLKCQADVMAFALNTVAPKYIVSNVGNAYAIAQSLTQQSGADVLTAITKGIVIVKESPRHHSVKFETKLVVHNFAEDMIDDRLLPVMNSMGMCTCPQCQADVTAFALNNFTPKYIVSNIGNAYAIAQSLTQQSGADVLTALTKGIVIVKARPRHNLKLETFA
jgi:competence protein ComFB